MTEFVFNSFNKLRAIIVSIIDELTPKKFLEFLDNLDTEMLIRLTANPKGSNRLNFLEILFQRHTRGDIGILKKILVLVGVEYYNYLLNKVLDNEGYIDLHVLEFLIYIDNKKIRDFLDNTQHKFKFDYGYDISWDFQLLLNILLLCYNPKELMMFLEENHKTVLFNTVLPEMNRFKFLKMSSYPELDMEHFITAFLLEEVRGDPHYENLDKLGIFLADIMLTELSDGNDENKEETNLRIIKALDWVGGEAEEKLNALPKQYNIEKYRDILY